MRFAVVVGGGFLRLQPLPLQCALFSEAGAMMETIGGIPEETILLDSVRHLILLGKLRARHPGHRIVVDMDDLMSRRVDQLLENRFDVSLGLFSDQMPAAFARLLANRTFARLLLRYERMALRLAERRICALADSVVMVSDVEAGMLRDAAGPGARAAIHAVTPPTKIPETVQPFAADAGRGPVRFAFVGTDKLIQNRAAIDWLIARWREHRPAAEVVIFGKQSRSYGDLPPNVRIHGFVDTIAEIYDGRTVLFSPTFLAGGVKTKFLEAFSYGAPVIGTRLTYEGVPPDPAFLAIEDMDQAVLFSNPEALRAQLSEAAARGRSLVVSHYSREAFSEKWSDILA